MNVFIGKQNNNKIHIGKNILVKKGIKVAPNLKKKLIMNKNYTKTQGDDNHRQ